MKLGNLRELIDDLERTEGEEVLEMEVFGEYDYGDYGHTRALSDFRDLVVTKAYKTAYSDSGLALRKGYVEDEDYIREDDIQVVALTV